MKLELNNVEITYSQVILVVRGISLKVEEGQIVTLLGANGAGKSTTLKAISGLLKEEDGRVTTGSIVLDDNRIENHDPEDISKLGVIQVMESRRIFEHLSVFQNLLVASRNDKSGFAKNLGTVYELFPKLKQLQKQEAGYISGGEQQMLAIGRALMASPKLLMLDEPSLGLAPLLIEHIYKVIGRINREYKVSILLVEQNARIALDIADYGYIMENGRLMLDGPSDELKEKEDVKEFYLGLTASGEKRHIREVKHYRRRKRWM